MESNTMNDLLGDKYSFAPAGAYFDLAFRNPRLTPWATIYRPYWAGYMVLP